MRGNAVLQGAHSKPIDSASGLSQKKRHLVFTTAHPFLLTMQSILHQQGSCVLTGSLFWRKTLKHKYLGAKICSSRIRKYCPARALRALGLLLVDGAPTVGGIFSYCVRARAYTHVLARAYGTRASTCTLYTCFTLPHTRVNLTGLQL